MSTTYVNERKVAQMAAFFLGQTEEKSMPYLKLMKLLYLADRESVHVYGWPISNDRFVAMEHGPVLSDTLNFIKGNRTSQSNGWNAWISDTKEGYEVSLIEGCRTSEEVLDELSPADLKILHGIHENFSKMDQWEIRDWTHKNCPEWQDPKNSSRPIEYEALACAVGYDEMTAKKMAVQFKEQQEINQIFAAL